MLNAIYSSLAEKGPHDVLNRMDATVAADADTDNNANDRNRYIAQRPHRCACMHFSHPVIVAATVCEVPLPALLLPRSPAASATVAVAVETSKHKLLVLATRPHVVLIRRLMLHAWKL